MYHSLAAQARALKEGRSVLEAGMGVGVKLQEGSVVGTGTTGTTGTTSGLGGHNSLQPGYTLLPGQLNKAGGVTDRTRASGIDGVGAWADGAIGVARDSEGKPVTVKVSVPLNKLVIDLYQGDGKQLGPDSNEVPTAFRFMVSGPGVDSSFVKRVVLPVLDYDHSSSSELLAEVEMFVRAE